MAGSHGLRAERDSLPRSARGFKGARRGAPMLDEEARLPKKHVTSDKAPRPIGPYSQGVIAGGFLYLSGQIPIDPATSELVGGDIQTQTRRVLDNLLGILKDAHLGAEDVVKTTVYLADINEFGGMNEVYAKYFGKEPPARSTIQAAALPRGVKIEIDLIAVF
jgi:2-iminobutanoate/2-iminopropanoate deaminase